MAHLKNLTFVNVFSIPLPASFLVRELSNLRVVDETPTVKQPRWLSSG
jgi:hypothetical protein